MEKSNNIKTTYPKLYQYIKDIQSLDGFDKIKVYIHYYATQLGLKNRFEAVDMINDNWNKGWGVPSKTVEQIAFYYLGKDVNIQTLDEFFSEDNIEVRDCGEDWLERGFAQRWWVERYGVYDWFWKFEDKFNLK